MGVLDVCLLLFIPYPGLYNKTHIQSVYKAIKRIYIYICVYIIIFHFLLGNFTVDVVKVFACNIVVIEFEL